MSRMTLDSSDFWFCLFALLFAAVPLAAYKVGERVGKTRANREWANILRNTKGVALVKPPK